MSARPRHRAASHVFAAHLLSASHRLCAGAARHSHARAGTGLADLVVTPNWLSSRGTLHATRARVRLLGKSDRHEADRTYGNGQASNKDRLLNVGHGSNSLVRFRRIISAWITFEAFRCRDTLIHLN